MLEKAFYIGIERAFYQPLVKEAIDSTVKRLKLNFVGASAEAITSPIEPTVQNTQDCPEDGNHLELTRKRSPVPVSSQYRLTYSHFR